MINLENEARKRRERLKSSSISNFKNSTENKEPLIVSKNEKICISDSNKIHELKRSNRRINDQDPEKFTVPEGEILLDSHGAELLEIDSEIPETLEAQAKSLLLPQNDLIINVDIEMINPKGRNSDLKREYERRMKALSKQTRRSIVDIVRKRLDKEAQESKAELDDIKN